MKAVNYFVKHNMVVSRKDANPPGDGGDIVCISPSLERSAAKWAKNAKLICAALNAYRGKK